MNVIVQRGLMALLGALLFVVLSPLIALFAPLPLQRHVYHEMAFQLIANRELGHSHAPEEIVNAAVDSSRRRLWLVDNVAPYPGKPFDYLVEGVGWCDYTAKVFCKLLAAKGIHARYVFLRDGRGRSPHTVAEVYLHGQWRVVDPFFSVVYPIGNGWARLEDITPAMVEALPEIALLKQTKSGFPGTVVSVGKRTFPLPEPPTRSDDFMADKHIFDWVADAYVNVFGSRVADWYQDLFLQRRLAGIPDPVDRLWVQARHYHLFGRLSLAEPCYRRLLALNPSRYHERTTLFLARMLIWGHHYREARDVLNTYLGTAPDTPWAHFQIALCDDALHDQPETIRHLYRYLELGGWKYAVQAMARIAQLEGVRRHSTL